MVPIEDRKSPFEPIYYSILSIGKGISDEVNIHNIFSIRSDMAVDDMREIDDEDGPIIVIYLKFSSCHTEVDE